MAAFRAPKQWCLTKHETVTTFENWRQNLKYTLSLDANFAQFLVEGVTWLKKSRDNPLRGFNDDGQDVQADRRHTAQQKVTQLELMLGQVANFCPVISRNTIVRNSTSIDTIWQAIRTHFGFQSTGAHFIDFADIKLEPQERPEDLFQRLMAFADDNLLQQNGPISHHGEIPASEEEMSPSLENFIVLTWLQLINKDLPRLVKQRYGTELRSRTLASIKPEISQAMDSLLEEVHATDDIRVMRSAVPNQRFQDRRPASSQKRYGSSSSRPRSSKECPLCKQAGRPNFDHFLSMCNFLPESDRKFMVKARLISSIDDEDDSVCDPVDMNTPAPPDDPPSMQLSSRRVLVKQSPFLHTFYRHHTVKVTLDSGAETNMIRESVARAIGANVSKSSQVAVQADGLSPLVVRGETMITLTRDDKQFRLEALVVENMDVDVLAGVPFMDVNDIAVRPRKHEVILGDGTTYQYGAVPHGRVPYAVRRTQSFVLRTPKPATIWPGEYLEVSLPDAIAPVGSGAES